MQHGRDDNSGVHVATLCTYVSTSVNIIHYMLYINIHTSKLPDFISLRNFRDPATLQRSPMLTKLVNLLISIFSIPEQHKSYKTSMHIYWETMSLQTV